MRGQTSGLSPPWFSRIHGGAQDEEHAALGLEAADVLDFSTNVNPYGPCAAVAQAVRDAALDRYPDPSGHAARGALGRALGVDPGEIALGNGATDLLWTLATLVAGAGRRALVVEPAFSEFRAAVGAAGGHVVEWRAAADDDFAVDLAAVARRVREESADALYLSAPTSPAGAPVPAVAIATLAAELPALEIVLDQSFTSLGDDFADLDAAFPPNVIRVRSLTKDHAIAAVRAGYLLARAGLVRRVEAARPAWTVSGLAQAAIAAAAGEPEFVTFSRERLREDRERLAAALRTHGWQPVRSTAPFLIVPVGDAAVIRRRLLAEQQILVRDCASFGLDGYLRLSARPRDDVERLAAALRSL